MSCSSSVELCGTGKILDRVLGVYCLAGAYCCHFYSHKTVQCWRLSECGSVDKWDGIGKCSLVSRVNFNFVANSQIGNLRKFRNRLFWPTTMIRCGQHHHSRDQKRENATSWRRQSLQHVGEHNTVSQLVLALHGNVVSFNHEPQRDRIKDACGRIILKERIKL